NRHGRYRGDHEPVAGQHGERAADGAGAEIADLAMPPHARRLEHFTRRGGYHDDADQQPPHWLGLAASGPGCAVCGALPPLTSATPATISPIPAQRFMVICSLSSTFPTSATSTYPTAVTGS